MYEVLNQFYKNILILLSFYNLHTKVLISFGKCMRIRFIYIRLTRFLCNGSDPIIHKCQVNFVSRISFCPRKRCIRVTHSIHGIICRKLLLSKCALLLLFLFDRVVFLSKGKYKSLLEDKIF